MLSYVSTPLITWVQRPTQMHVKRSGLTTTNSTDRVTFAPSNNMKTALNYL